jgi:hypothetical protein
MLKKKAPAKRKKKKMSTEELQKEAQAKLAEARKLIKEAGQLAEKGSFTLHFGEIGSYYPKAMFDSSFFEAEATKIAQEEGLTIYGRSEYDYNARQYRKVTADVHKKWDELTEPERIKLVDQIARELRSEAFGGSEAAEYGSPGWWHPSRC